MDLISDHNGYRGLKLSPPDLLSFFTLLIPGNFINDDRNSCPTFNEQHDVAKRMLNCEKFLTLQKMCLSVIDVAGLYCAVFLGEKKTHCFSIGSFSMEHCILTDVHSGF